MARRVSCRPTPEPKRPDLRPVDGPEADRELARLARAVAHPARVRILRLLRSRNACICGEIVDKLPLAQSTISQHLKVLRDAGLIRGDVEGATVCYGLAQKALCRLKALVAFL